MPTSGGFVMEKEKMREIRNIIEDINSKGISEEAFLALNPLLNVGDIPLHFSNVNPKAASFSPNYRTILVNTKKMISWVDEMVKQSLNYFYVSDVNLLKSYLVVYVLSHEVDHSVQYLIGKGDMEGRFPFNHEVYKDLFNIIVPKKYIIPRPISFVRDTYRFFTYQKNAYDYILERNASIEGYDLAANIAREVGDVEIADYMISSRNTFMLIGYAQDGTGALKATYSGLKMMRKYNKLNIPEMSLLDKCREGVEITEEERKLVLSSIKGSMKFK
jgi:hypothetical protein